MAGVSTGANQSLTSAAIGVDPYLSLSLEPNTQYNIQAVLDWSQVNVTDGGFAAGFQVLSGSTTLRWTDASGTTFGSGTVSSYINVSGPRLLELSGTVITGGSTDTLQVIRGLAQASVNATTFFAGSTLTAIRVANVPSPGPVGGLTASQICDLARQIVNVPGYMSQSGQLLNAILGDLAQTYDFEANLQTYAFTFDTATVYQNNVAGAGPNLFPSDYLRAKNRELIYYIQGVRYVLIIETQANYDALVQTTGWTSYPTYGYVDLNLQFPFSTSNPGQPGLMVWPPASGSYPVQLRYYALPATISSPETSIIVPWFPNTNYLITRLAGELMKLTDDERTQSFLGSEEETSDTAMSATSILRKFLKMKDDPEGIVKTVQLDRRRFGSQFANLKNTKVVGW